MNYATTLASHDWVLCMDSDEILDNEVVAEILRLKAGEDLDPACAWRLPRYWYVLGEPVRTIYPVSSPDYPVRLFNRTTAAFNNRAVDRSGGWSRPIPQTPGSGASRYLLFAARSL